MAAASRSEFSSNQEFFILDDEDEGDFSTLSDPHDSRVDFSSISSSITSKSLASFLQTLSEVYKPPSNENWLLTLAKEAVFNDSKSVLKEELLKDISHLVEVCFSEAGTEKNSQKYAIKLEKAFAEKRNCSFHHLAIRQSWEKFVFDDSSDHDHEASDNLLQQLLQHFWSSHSDSRINTVEGGQSAKDPATSDESDFDSIRDHAGWVIKRARDTLMKGKDEVPAKESETDSTIIQGSKIEALNLISSLGEDVKQTDGKFRFIVYKHVVSFFLFLHNLVESLITPTTMVAQKGNILIDCLEKISKNKAIREKWSCIVPISDTPSSVVLLQRIVTFFLKSKQQILREKGGLKPNKNSMAIRQQLKKKGKPSKQKDSKEIDELRSGNITSDQFLQSLSVYPEFKQEEILSLLNRKELAKILKSLGKPSFLGKKKSKQIETLIHVMKT